MLRPTVGGIKRCSNPSVYLSVCPVFWFFSRSLNGDMRTSPFHAHSMGGGQHGRLWPLPNTIKEGISLHCVFTARRYAKRGICRRRVSVCLSVTFWYCMYHIKTAKRKISQVMAHDNPGTLVFWWQRSRRNSNGIISYEGAGGVG